MGTSLTLLHKRTTAHCDLSSGLSLYTFCVFFSTFIGCPERVGMCWRSSTCQNPPVFHVGLFFCLFPRPTGLGLSFVDSHQTHKSFTEWAANLSLLAAGICLHPCQAPPRRLRAWVFLYFSFPSPLLPISTPRRFKGLSVPAAASSVATPSA